MGYPFRVNPLDSPTAVKVQVTREMRDAKALWLKIDRFLRVHSQDGANMALQFIATLPLDQRVGLDRALERLPSAIRASPAQANTRQAMLKTASALVEHELSKLAHIPYEDIFADNDEFR